MHDNFAMHVEYTFYNGFNTSPKLLQVFVDKELIDKMKKQKRGPDGRKLAKNKVTPAEEEDSEVNPHELCSIYFNIYYKYLAEL